MRSSQRLRALKQWVYERLCKGREMKTMGKDESIFDIVYAEPQCFLGWAPDRPDLTGRANNDPINVTPSIVVMPNPSLGKAIKEQNVDIYRGIVRPKALGQTLNVTLLFSVYEPGIRLPGFIDAPPKVDYTKLQEGTEEGLLTLYDWMDDGMQALLAEQRIPGTDMFVNEGSITYSLYMDERYVVDKRPFFYGFINVEFGCFAEENNNPTLEAYLE